MSTETELVLSSLTRDEVDESVRWLHLMLDAWGTDSQKRTFSTDGPWWALKALELALLREIGIRHGADAWYVGLPLEGHPAAQLLRTVAARYALNPDRRNSPRTNPAGVVVARCLHCGEEKALTEEYFERGERLWSLACRSCVTVDPERFRRLILDEEVTETKESARRRDAAIADLVFDELARTSA